MRDMIKWMEHWAFLLTNKAVDNIRQDKDFNRNHLAKMLYWQCEMYQNIISNLLEK